MHDIIRSEIHLVINVGHPYEILSESLRVVLDMK